MASYDHDSNIAMIWAIVALMCRVEAIWKNKWDGVIWSHHGEDHYTKWWFDKCFQECPIQVDTVENIPYFHVFITAFVKIEDPDMDKLH
eukprot:13932333-Ditylum_brightwellii.AAC.1